MHRHIYVTRTICCLENEGLTGLRSLDTLCLAPIEISRHFGWQPLPGVRSAVSVPFGQIKHFFNVCMLHRDKLALLDRAICKVQGTITSTARLLVVARNYSSLHSVPTSAPLTTWSWNLGIRDELER
jgi:hypothetical protein